MEGQMLKTDLKPSLKYRCREKSTSLPLSIPPPPPPPPVVATSLAASNARVGCRSIRFVVSVKFSDYAEIAARTGYSLSERN
jgi:hypothetical protein